MRYELNTAYDYNRILDKNAAPRRLPENRQKAKISTIPVKREKANSRSKLFIEMTVAVVMIFMVCFNIYTRSEISDTKKEISNLNSQIEELDSEYTALEMEMQNIVSYSNLEQEAAKLGMHKKTSSQVHYINTAGDDRAEIVDGKGNK